MSRHSARVDPERTARVEHLAAAVIAVVAAAALAVTARIGRPELVVALGVLQLLLVLSWVLGTGLPGRIGGLLIGAAAALGADAALVLHQPATLDAVLAVLALSLPAMLVHQLSRGVVRVRVTESLSGVTVGCAAVCALAAYLALFRTVDGPRLVSAAAVASGAGLLVGYLTDSVMPRPRFDPEVPKGLLGVILSTGAGAAVGALHALHNARLSLAGGALLGAVVAAVAALVSVGVGYLAQPVEPVERDRGRLASLAMAYLRVLLPLALTAPIGYLVGLYVAG
jgi:hypothetical protein